MDPHALLNDYLAHIEDAPRPFADDRRPQRLLAEPADQPLTEAIAAHEKPAAQPRRRIA